MTLVSCDSMWVSHDTSVTTTPTVSPEYHRDSVPGEKSIVTKEKAAFARSTCLPYSEPRVGVQLEHGGLPGAACRPELERWHHVHAVVQGNLGERRPHAALGARRLGGDRHPDPGPGESPWPADARPSPAAAPTGRLRTRTVSRSGPSRSRAARRRASPGRSATRHKQQVAGLADGVGAEAQPSQHLGVPELGQRRDPWGHVVAGCDA